jgi:hypothetical protein
LKDKVTECHCPTLPRALTLLLSLATVLLVAGLDTACAGPRAPAALLLAFPLGVLSAQLLMLKWLLVARQLGELAGTLEPCTALVRRAGGDRAAAADAGALRGWVGP